MKKIELGFSALCFLLALIAAALIAHDDVTLGFIVAWGGSAVVTVAYAALLLQRHQTAPTARAQARDVGSPDS